MKPRLLILTNRLIVGGISNDIIPLAYYLQRDFDILILYGEKAQDEIEAGFLLQKYPGLNLKKIPSLRKHFNPFNDIKAYKKIRKEIVSFKVDIVHTHGAKSGFIGRLAAFKSKVPVIIHTYHGHHFHSYYNRFISKWIVNMERWMVKFTTKIIATSQQQWDDLVERYKIAGADKVKIISLGIDKSQFFAQLDKLRAFRKKYYLDSAIAVGMIARITRIKNFDLFANVVFKVINQVEQTVKFFVIGDGVLKKDIQERLTNIGIKWCNAGDDSNGCTVIFTSWIEDIADIISALDIVILTSNNEGTGLSLVEAQLSGKPVVATNAGGVRDTVLDNETGFLVEPNNADVMTEKLKLLIENDSLRKKMGLKAMAFAEENFSKRREVESYKQLYKALLAQKNIQYPKLQTAIE